MAVVAILMACNGAIAGSRLRMLDAREIRQTLLGNVITDGTHWSYHLKQDGSIDAFEMGRERKGHWHLEGKRLCIAIKAGAAPDQCFEVMWEGKNLVFGVEGRIVYDVKVEVPRH